MKINFNLKLLNFQMGGSLIISQKGQLLYQHFDSYHGDYAKIMEVVSNYYDSI
jgi:hypothetical protein